MSKAYSNYFNSYLDKVLGETASKEVGSENNYVVYTDTSSLMCMRERQIVPKCELAVTEFMYKKEIEHRRKKGEISKEIKIVLKESHGVIFHDDWIEYKNEEAEEWLKKIKEAAKNGDKEKDSLDKISNADFSLIYQAVETWRLTGSGVVVLSEDRHIKETVKKLSEKYPELENIKVVSIRDIVEEYKNQRENNYASASA